MRALALILLIFFPLFTRGSGQSVQDTVSSGNIKNVVFGTFGVYPLAIYNINYERNIYYKPVTGSVSSINLRLGFGKEADPSGSAELLLASTNFIFGPGSGHVEADLGAAYLFNIIRDNYDKKTGFSPLVNLGYRFQRNDGHFVFRTGLGWPDCIYASLGFAF
ncbi:MAG: hypothetical protein V1903_06235 [Bacteroidota bacterium]